MTSSVLAGERRWASARKSGMTVLGKVAVPKPLNLPSQRLENNGLDPNVEIVPKGTLSWGNCSSSSSSSAWGSLTLSPNTDGSTNSPTHLSGRPSSGGSGTRPSTASSDRLHEPTANAWGPNSRPSSASGSLTSSQTSMASLCPCSAETRPCSSQLSRFAEPSSDNSIACGPSGTAQKLGAASSNSDEFSLSSGDFPTLGSEKDSTLKISEPRDHGSHLRPSSSSGRIVPKKERAVTSQADQKSGNVDTWKENVPHNIEDGVECRVENWQGDSKQCPNVNIPPQPFDVWRGHPVNAAPGVWYRGPPGCPPYGAPCGFPIEPFPYYCPQILPNLAHSQPVPSTGPGPRGPHPKNDDVYRPQLAEAYIRPGMPIRPGFYPGPMAYDGYYGPPIGYCNSSERDVPFMGMTASPSVYNRFPTCNTPTSNVYAVVGGHASTAKASVSEQGKSNHLDDSQGPYKVLQKQQNHWDRKEQEENLKHTEHNAMHVGEGDKTGTMSGKNESRVDGRRNEMDHTRSDEKYSRRTPTEFSPSPANHGSNSLDSVKASAKDSMVNTKMVDVSGARKLESAASSFLRGPKVMATSPKDSNLIQNIEGLNAKARASDGRHDVFTSTREEQKKQVQVSHKDKNSLNDADDVALCPNITHAIRNPVPGSLELDVLTEKASQPTVSNSIGMIISRRVHQSVQGRVDHRNKGRFSTDSADGWRKRSVAVESSTAAPTIRFEPSTDFHPQDHNPSKEVAAKSVIDLPANLEGGFLTPNLDSSGGQAQYAKMRELTKQPELQLQKEEEDRTREKKAKALAKLEELNKHSQVGDSSTKLEELNKHSQVGDSSTQKVEDGQQGSGIQWRQEESARDANPVVVVATKFEEPSSALVSHINVVTPSTETSSTDFGQLTTIPIEYPCGMLRSTDHEVNPHVQSLSSEQGFHKADSRTDDVVVPQVSDKTIPRNKRMGYKQKQNVLAENNSTGRSAPISMNKDTTNNGDLLVNNSATSQVVPGEVVSGGVPNNSNIMTDLTAQQHQRRKDSRGGKNKPRMDDISSSTSLTALKETHSREPSTENAIPNVPPSELDPSCGQSVTNAKDCVACMEQHPSLPTEDPYNRETSQWKSQRGRRIPRNSQCSRFADRFHCNDTVFWAPVQSQNKAEVINEAIVKTVTDAVNPDSKCDGVIQNNIRSKRAEMKRYIPKPVAKELAQHECIFQPSLSSSDQTADEPGGRVDVQSDERSKPESGAIGNTGSTAESKNGYNIQSKHAKVHGAWRQRGSADALHRHGLHGTSSTSDPNNTVEQHQSLKPDLDLAKDGLKSCDGKTSNGWNNFNKVDPVAPVSSVLKEQGSMGKGKHHTFTGHRSISNDQDDCVIVNSVEPEKITIQFGILEMGEAERIIATKEHHRTGEGALSHWQPKSQTNDQLGSSFTVVQNISTEVGRDTKKNPSPSSRLHPAPQHVGERKKNTAQPHSDQTVVEYKNTKEAPNFGHQEGRRDRRMASSQRRPYSPIQGPVTRDDPAPFERKATSSRNWHYSPNQGPVIMDENALHAQYEQRVSSEFHKNGNRSNRPGKRHESRGDWSSSRQHGVPTSHEKQGQSSHYEYQAIGPCYSGKSNNFEGPDFSQSHNTVSRYRERGQGHSHRGGGSFHGREVDSGCGWWGGK